MIYFFTHHIQTQLAHCGLLWQPDASRLYQAPVLKLTAEWQLRRGGRKQKRWQQGLVTFSCSQDSSSAVPLHIQGNIAQQ